MTELTAGPPGALRQGMPVVGTPLFGRDRDVSAVCTALTESRLVTITGQGGVGKTRVAIEAANRQHRRVIFVPLAEVDHIGVAGAISRACSEAEETGTRTMACTWAVLAARCAADPLLLVLDTFEHVSGAAVIVAEMLKAIPDLAVLVTSRTRLGLRDERALPLSGLPVDPDGPATAMFWERSRCVGGDRLQRPTEQDAVVDICRLLGGIPLAIELAAARTAVFTPSALLARLRLPDRSRVLGLLAHGPVDLPGRQVSMRATLSWSYQLLEPAHQLLFRRLAVFPGSFDLETAEQVCGSNGAGGGWVAEEALLEGIATLVDLHLAKPVPAGGDGAGGQARFTLHEVPRAFAVELLELSGEARTLNTRLHEWCLDFAHRADRGMASADESVWLDRVEDEMPLIRHTLAALARDADPARGISLATGIAAFWTVRGPLLEATKWLRTFLEIDRSHGRLPEQLRALALGWLDRLALESAEPTDLDHVRGARAAVVRAPCSPAIWLRCTDHLLAELAVHGGPGQTLPLIQEGLQRARAADDSYWTSVYLWRRAVHEWTQESTDRGRLTLPYAQEAFAAAQHGGHRRLAAGSQTLIGYCQMADREWAGAYRTIEGAAAGLREIGDAPGLCTAMATLGAILVELGEPLRAGHFLSQAIASARRIGYGYGEVHGAWAATYLAAHCGRSREATLMADALAGRLPLIERMLPQILLADYIADVAAARREQGQAPAFRSIGRGWGWLRTQALDLATEFATLPASSAGEVSARSGADPRTPARPRREAADAAAVAGIPRQSARADRGVRQGELTARELQILSAIASGLTNAQIATDLFLSAKTVMHHSTNIYRKLAVGGRAEAVALAYRTGLLQAPLT